jgi:hypothetical protein
MGAVFGVELGYQRIILEGDALEIVQALRNKDPSWSRYGQLIEDTKAKLNSLPFWTVSHVCRNANEPAHRLAQAAIHQSCEGVWLQNIPGFIQNLVLAEQDFSI